MSQFESVREVAQNPDILMSFSKMKKFVTMACDSTKLSLGHSFMHNHRKAELRLGVLLFLGFVGLGRRLLGLLLGGLLGLLGMSIE